MLVQGVLTLSTIKAASDLADLPIVGLDARRSHDAGPVTVTAVPALYGPTGAKTTLGPAIGFVIEVDSWPTRGRPFT